MICRACRVVPAGGRRAGCGPGPTSVGLLVLLVGQLSALPFAGARPPARRRATAGPPRISPRTHHPVASPFIARLLRDPGLARRVLTEGDYVRRGSRYRVSIMLRRKPRERSVMFRIAIRLPGHPPVQAFFKPRQRGYRDWATETAVCRLARWLRVTTAPCHERSVPRAVLAAALERVPPDYRRLLRWDSARKKKIFGFFRLWAPAYVPYLGKIKPTRKALLALASSLRADRREAVLEDPVLRQLSDIFLLDFLVYNNDRRRNLGTVRISKRQLRLFPIDFGDGLSVSPRRKLLCRRLLARTRLFRRALVERIRALDAEQVRHLLTHPKFGLLVEPVQLEHLMRQRARLLAHVARVLQKDGPKALY